MQHLCFRRDGRAVISVIINSESTHPADDITYIKHIQLERGLRAFAFETKRKEKANQLLVKVK